MIQFKIKYLGEIIYSTASTEQLKDDEILFISLGKLYYVDHTDKEYISRLMDILKYFVNDAIILLDLNIKSEMIEIQFEDTISEEILQCVKEELLKNFGEREIEQIGLDFAAKKLNILDYFYEYLEN